eukprot:g15682.t1
MLDDTAVSQRSALTGNYVWTAYHRHWGRLGARPRPSWGGGRGGGWHRGGSAILNGSCREQNARGPRDWSALIRQRARDSGAHVTVNAWHGMEETALREFKAAGLTSMAFPARFPGGTGDPTDLALSRSVKPTDCMKHLLKFLRYGRCRFASHPRFPHWCQEHMFERHRMLSQAQVYLKQSRGRGHDDRVHLESVLVGVAAGSAAHPAHMCQYGANVTGSRPYCYASQQELQSIFATKGCATLFFKLSAGDTHLDGLFDLMPPGYEGSPAG